MVSVSWVIIILLASTKLRGGYTGFTLSVRPSVRPSVDKIVSALYFKQYWPDPIHIYTISTNQKITEIIFWLVKNGMTRNTRISLAKKYTMAPGHQLYHLYIRAHSTQPQHQYLRVLTEYFCLWRVTYSDESAQAIPYHFPGPQASLHPPPPPTLLTCHFLAVKWGCCRPAHHLRPS